MGQEEEEELCVWACDRQEVESSALEMNLNIDDEVTVSLVWLLRLLSQAVEPRGSLL